MTREYTFRWDPEQQVLWAGERSYPARFYRESATDHIPKDDPFLADRPGWHMETRRAIVWFENQWQLSTIWGDATYSSNTWFGLSPGRHDFIEEPSAVEVGVMAPEFGLWGDPLGYVEVPEFHRLADLVMMLPHEIELPEGEWESVQGFCDLLITAGLAKTL